jgi:hypothetical protein
MIFVGLESARESMIQENLGEIIENQVRRASSTVL